MTDLASLDATATAEVVRSGLVKPTEVIDAAIDRIERLEPQLNAFVCKFFDDARAEALAPDVMNKPFPAVPFVVKDLDCGTLAGKPWYGGTRFMQRIGWTEPEDSFLVQGLKDHGFIILGKTATPALGSSSATISDVHGRTGNPWNRAHAAGGSSGGTGAAVASRMVPAGHGGDGGGSIRIPASACGLFGMKPTRGRVSNGPQEGDAWSGIVCRGPITRTVRDSALLLDIMARPRPGDPYPARDTGRPYVEEVARPLERLKISVLDATVDPLGFPIEPEVLAVMREVAELLAGAGHRVEAGHPDRWYDSLDVRQDSFLPVVKAWMAYEIDDIIRRSGEQPQAGDFSPALSAWLEDGRALSAIDYIAATERLHGWSRVVESWWEDWDILMTPTMPFTPPTNEAYLGEEGRTISSRATIFAFQSNITGQPAMSVPLGMSADNLPIGIQFIAADGREDKLFRLAAFLEEAMPWRQRIAPISA